MNESKSIISAAVVLVGVMGAFYGTKDWVVKEFPVQHDGHHVSANYASAVPTGGDYGGVPVSELPAWVTAVFATSESEAELEMKALVTGVDSGELGPQVK
jgi:hypothetical protein